MDSPSNVRNQFGEAHARGEGITVQAGVNNGTININQRSRNTLFPKAVLDATFDAANKEHVSSCLPGTRVKVLGEIRQWIDGDNPKSLYWLNGMAGTGKSTIALTLARMYKVGEGKSTLAGTFFFSRGSGDLSSASSFAATIAMQLLELSSHLRNLIERAVEFNPRLESLGLQEQWDKLVVQPLSEFYRLSSSQSPRLLLLIDALDECSDANEIKIVIKCLEILTRIEGGYCRVFLTSRPDQPVKMGLSDNPSSSRENFVLHDIERSIVDSDIGLYYRDQLSRIKAEKFLDENLLSEKMVDQLVERSHGLFIHATTVCRFVQKGSYAAIERLTQLLGSEKSITAEQELDKMYTTVLEYSFVSVTRQLDSREAEIVQDLFQRIIGSIVVIFDVMSPEELANLLGEALERVLMTLSALHSVIDVPEDQKKPIRILHPTFREFLLDAKRCVNSSYTIVSYKAHGNLVTRCFEILFSKLKRNPVCMDRPGTKTQDVSIEIINSCIQISLQYSARYLIDHILKAISLGCRIDVIVASLLPFLEDKYLFWLESLAWIGQLASALRAMAKLHAFITEKLPEKQPAGLLSFRTKKAKGLNYLVIFIEDCIRFLRTYVATIEEAPLQTYSSALPFSPRKSLVRMRNHKQRPGWILNDPSTIPEWSQSSRSISLHHSPRVYSVAFSPSGELVATACDDGMIHVWYAATGSMKYKLEGNGHDDASVAFSPNEDQVASVTSATLSIWDIRKPFGHIIPTDSQIDLEKLMDGTEFELPESRFSSRPVSIFSPDGKSIAVTAGSCGVLILDVTSPKSPSLTSQFVTEAIEELYFSKNGSILIPVMASKEGPWRSFEETGSYSLTAWDTRTGLQLESDHQKSLDEVGPLTISPVSTRYIVILNLREPRTIGRTILRQAIVRDARTGSEYSRFTLGRSNFWDGYLWIALFKPNSDEILIMTVVDSRMVLWTSHECQQPRLLSTDSKIQKIAFSPDGRFVISVHDMNKVNIWNIEDFLARPSQWESVNQELQYITITGKLLNKVTSMVPNHSLTEVDNSTLRVPLLSSRWDRYSHYGRILVTSSLTRPSFAVVWDTSSGNQICQFEIPVDFTDLALSPDGAVLAILTNDGVQIWETRTGKKGDKSMPRLSDQAIETFTILFSLSGRKIFLVPKLQYNMHRLNILVGWDVDIQLRTSPFKVQIPGWRLPKLAFSPDETIYAAWSRFKGGIQVRSSSNNQLKCGRDIDSLRHIKIRGDNKLIWLLARESSRRSVAFIWNIEGDELKWLAEYESHRVVKGAIFSDNQHLLAVHVSDGLEIFDMADLSLQRRIRLDCQPRDVVFSFCESHITTSRGLVPFPGAWPLPSPRIFVTYSWVQEDGIDIVAIPPAYRTSGVIVDGQTVIIFDPTTNGPIFLKLDTGTKTLS